MCPNDAHKEQNKQRVRKKYIIKYNIKHDKRIKYNIND